jgi:hypothetical protein
MDKKRSGYYNMDDWPNASIFASNKACSTQTMQMFGFFWAFPVT